MDMDMDAKRAIGGENSPVQSVTVMQSSTEPKRHLVNGVISPPLANMQNSTDAKRRPRLLVVNGFVSLPPPAKRQRVEMMGKEKALALRKKHVAPSLSLHYSKVNPPKIGYGQGQYLYDEQDQPYLDCINNVTHVGHCHPQVTEAGAEQMAKLADVHDPQITEKYTQHLLSTFPDNMGHVFYVHSGTEANDLALMIAETVTGHSEVIVIDGAYHGHSKPLMGLSSYKMKQEKDGETTVSPNPHAWISYLPDPFRGKYTDRATAGQLYAGEVKKIIESMEREGKELASFLCESFPGCAGQLQLPEGYFKAVFDHVHKAGGLCIIDEVQTGFGRGGEHFWMFKSQGVRPDIVTVGKPMGNGHPTSAVITTKKIARDYLMKCPDTHGEYLGDPVSLAISEAVLCVVEEEGLATHAAELGDYIITQLRELAQKHPCIGDVREGSLHLPVYMNPVHGAGAHEYQQSKRYGLFIGVELTEGAGSKTPNGQLAEDVTERLLLKHRIMIKNDGLDQNVLKIKPPMCFTRANADTILHAMDQTLTELGQ